MKLTAIGRTMGDETTPFIVTDYQAKTVAEFVNEVLKEEPKEWGYFKVKHETRGFLFLSPYRVPLRQTAQRDSRRLATQGNRKDRIMWRLECNGLLYHT
jgi:hypothetical protein